MATETVLTLSQKIVRAAITVGGRLKSDKRNTEQNYDYISADKILAECGQALSEQGVSIIPSIIQREISVVERTDKYGNVKPRYDCTVEFSMRITDGTMEYINAWFGMGSDYTVPDKALYKAITSGHKYFLSKLLCIGEGNEDSENEPAEQTVNKPASPKNQPQATPAKKEQPAALKAWPAETITHFCAKFNIIPIRVKNMLDLSGLDYDMTLDVLDAWSDLYKEYRAETPQPTPQEAAKLANDHLDAKLNGLTEDG